MTTFASRFARAFDEQFSHPGCPGFQSDFMHSATNAEHLRGTEKMWVISHWQNRQRGILSRLWQLEVGEVCFLAHKIPGVLLTTREASEAVGVAIW